MWYFSSARLPYVAFLSLDGILILILIYSRSIDHTDVELVKKGVQVVV